MCDTISAKFARIQSRRISPRRRHRHRHQPAEGRVHLVARPCLREPVPADGINRAPAKVQSALLEAMADARSPSATRRTPALAVHRHGDAEPIEQEGTIPAPEAQVDRFMLTCKVGYRPARGRAEDHGCDDRHHASAGRTGGHPDGADGSRCARRASAGSTWRQGCDGIVDVIFATREPQACGLKDRAPHRVPAPTARASPSTRRPRARLPPSPRLRTTKGSRARSCVLRRVVLTYEADAEEVTSGGSSAVSSRSSKCRDPADPLSSGRSCR